MVLRVLVALALLCSVAVAQGGDKPWAAGVSETDQKAALAKYGEANELFEKGAYVEALPVYEQALASWKHPGIYFNAAVCLINLDRPVEAYDYLEKALAYGEAPLGRDLHTQGKSYMKALGAQVATLAITLKTPGAVVRLDGETLLDAPGTVTRRVLSSKKHEIVAEKNNYETETRTIQLDGGETTTLVLELKLKSRGRTVRRWARWKPWAVVGASGAIGLAGLATIVSSKSMFEDYDTAFSDDPVCGDGCTVLEAEERGLEDTRRSAEFRQSLGYGIVGLAGATLATGLVLVVLNQPRLVGATVTPTIGKERAGATLSFSW